ncbi:MAG: bifunctional ornithine acetyltransferase/N-acetylglutamate synthase [Firmicutes bacterium]|nr:bifunctional ornithine acetyltransferase/N-acetylglutamate synthase [Bacillota bacterium]
MEFVKGNTVSPKGFLAGGAQVGIKKGKEDMALIISKVPANAAGVFTTNVVKAAPVLWDIKNIENKISGIVANSGNANACTGEKGLKDAEDTAEKLAKNIGVNKENILVCSTGVIGVNLPMDAVLSGVDKVYALVGDSFEKGENAAKAIMTTDTVKKTVCIKENIGGKEITLAGMAKGSGMINPNMATMLCFITTDAAISRKLLDRALKEAVLDTFNMICVDGDMSTNDTVLVLANGCAENKEITEEDADYEAFKATLFAVMKDLAVKCAKDGEGATKLIEAKALGVKNKEEARKIALSVVSSNLLKAAIFGEDANWGRALCAMGYSGADFDPMKVTIVFKSEKGEITLMDEGVPIVFDEDKAATILSADKINIDMYLNQGESEATAWGCDLTYEYVKINGDYRS